MWVHAEGIINKRQYRFTDHNKRSLKKNVHPNFDYNHKSNYLDSKIEQDIRFFKNNYTEKKKELYDLKKEVASKIMQAQRKMDLQSVSPSL